MTDDKDVLCSVMLSLPVTRKWASVVAEAVQEMVEGGQISPDSAAEEETAYVQRDGSLEIRGSVDGREIVLSVPPGEWRWIT